MNRNGSVIIIVLLVILILAAGGVAYAYYLWGRVLNSPPVEITERDLTTPSEDVTVDLLVKSTAAGIQGAERARRDAIRVGALTQAENGVVSYFNKNGHFPLVKNWAQLQEALLTVNLTIPNDPNLSSGHPNYVYATDTNGSGYVFKAILEDPESQQFQRAPKFMDFSNIGISMTCDQLKRELCISI